MIRVKLGMLMLTGVDLTDAELLHRFRAGDVESFVLLHRRYSRALYLYARTLEQDSSRSEDLVQEAFVRLMRYDPDRLEDDARAFLYAVVRNLIRDEARKSSFRRRTDPLIVALDPERSPVESSRLVQLAETVSGALEKLPEEQREAVVLKIYSGMTFAQIAALTGVSFGTVASRYRYAIEKLGEILADEQVDR